MKTYYLLESNKPFLIKILVILFCSLLTLAIQTDQYHSCQHDEVDYTNMVPSNFFSTYSTLYATRKFQSDKAVPIRITYEVGDIPKNQTGVTDDYIFALFDSLIIYMYYFIKVVPRVDPIKNTSLKTTCNSYSYPTYFQNSGVPNSDFHIFITHINSPSTNIPPFHGWWCELDPNPVAGVIQINYAKISKNKALSDGFQMNFLSLLHQFIHLLGFSNKLIPYWIDYSIKQPYGSQANKILQTDYSFGGNTNTHFLKSFNVKFYANNYYDCSNAEGMVLENQAAITARVSHWEFDLTGNELMVEKTSIYSIIQLSQLSLSLLRDTGYYDSVNTNMVPQQFWGKSERCEFMEKNCRSTSFTYLEFNSNPGLQCDFQQLGFVNPSIPLPNSECSMAHLDVTNLCTNTSDNPPDEVNRMNTGLTSRCFQSNVYKVSGGSITNNVKCFKTECNPSFTSIVVTIWGAEKVYCNFQDELINLDGTSGTAGFIKCPSNFQNFCSMTPFVCKNNCNNKGFCNKGVCFCINGFAGDDCSQSCGPNQVFDSSCATACGSGKFRTPSNTCSTTCPQGFYGEIISQSCVICHPFCSHCTGPSSTECKGCNFPYLFDDLTTTCTDRKCHTSCQTCFGLLDDNCLKCNKGYYLDSTNRCQQCDSSCKECEGSATQCSNCPSTPYYFYVKDPITQLCVSSCDKSCLTCSSPNSSSLCLSCPDGYFLKLGQCLSCQSPCKTCVTNKYLCQSCITGYEYQGSNVCTVKCDPSCKTCFSPGVNGCMSCYSGFFYNAGQCMQCESPCKTCIGMKSACQTCIDGYKIESISCKIICDTSCLTCTQPYLSNACSSCKPGYYLTTLNTCQQCQSPCQECVDTALKCTKCINGYQLDIITNSCKIICDDACEGCLVPQDSTQCLKCASEYKSTQSTIPLTCIKCPNPCQSCLPGTSICSNCSDGYQLIGNQCQMQCHPACQTCSEPYNSFKCSSCSNGYYLSGNKCLECQSSCKTCVDSPANCLSCNQNFKLSGSKCILGCYYSCQTCLNTEDENSCISCQPGFYFQSSQIQQNFLVGQCHSCQSNCEKCLKIQQNGSDILKCLECKSGYEFDIKGNCALCHSSCETCFKPNDPQACLSCYSPYKISKSNSCIQCSSGEYYSINDLSCNKCQENCKTCSFDSICEVCNSGYEVNENMQCQKSTQCHFSCQDCDTSLYSSCYTCSENRILIILNEDQKTGICNCPWGTSDTGEAKCEDSPIQQIIQQTSQLSFGVSTALVTIVSILNANPIPFFIMMEFCQSVSFLTYVNYKPSIGLDEVLNTVSYVHLSKIKAFNSLFSSDHSSRRRQLDEFKQDQSNEANTEAEDNEDNAKFKMNEKNDQFLENSILIIGINFLTWILSGYFSLLKVKKQNSFLLKVKRLFCISAPIAIFTLSSQEYSLLVFLQLKKIEYDQTIQILNLAFALLSLVYIATMLVYLTFQLEYTRKVQRSKRYQLDTENNKSQRNDLSNLRYKNELAYHKNSRQDLSNYVPSRNELSTQKILFFKPSQMSQAELSKGQPTTLQELCNENKSNESQDKNSSNEQPSPQCQLVPQYKIHLYLIYKFVKQENAMTRNFIQITIVRKIIISISCVAVTTHPIAQVSVQLLGYILYSIYLLIAKPLKYPKQMLMVCVADSIITLMHIIYIIMISYSDDPFIQKLMSMIILFLTITVFILYFVYSVYILIKLFYLQVQKCIHRSSQIRFKKREQNRNLEINLANQEKKDETIMQINQQLEKIDQAKSPNCTLVFSTQKFISPKQSARENYKQ